MSNNELIDANLYISPMNFNGIDNIKNKNQSYVSKISSSFYPDLDLT